MAGAFFVVWVRAKGGVARSEDGVALLEDGVALR